LVEKNKTEALHKIECFLLDMDGTIYLDNNLLPGAKDFISLLNERGIAYLFLTNNSSKDANLYVQKLNKLGVPASKKMILTSGEATATYLQRKNKGASLFVVGTPALKKEFVSSGFLISDDEPDMVVLGFDTTLNYEKLWNCCNFIRDGLPYIATHPDVNCPTKDGFMPDIGSFIALIEASTGRLPDEIIGKPYAAMVEAIEFRTGVKRENICMIGDRLYTDIALGKFGIQTILVLSGEATEDDIDDAEIKPDFVMKDLSEVFQAMK